MTPLEILKKYWGYDGFRSPQSEIIDLVLSKQDSFVVMPTGGGKSLCYQVPALCMDGICLVISPLIALMEDQVSGLNNKEIPALLINSTLGKREIEVELQNVRNGKYKFLYLSPERLKSQRFLSYLPTLPISFIAVDEAHCISQWGYDFRPSYLEIAQIKEILPEISIIALTASATAKTAQDIIEKLELRDPQIFRSSIRRPNLKYRVVDTEDKRNYIARSLHKTVGSALIYVNSRAISTELCKWLQNEGFNASFYHAGLTHEERNSRQNSWVAGDTRVMVCTNAFGMGVDKPDVRLVLHFQPPSSMEAYYQEAGRAGRDGKNSECVLLYTDFDITREKQNFQNQYPHLKFLNKLYEMVANSFQLALNSGEGRTFAFDLAEFCPKFGFKPLEVHYGLKLLELIGYFSLSEGVRTPSRIKMNLAANDLYTFQVKHPQYEPLIKVLLRSYGGILDRYVSIQESDVAERLKQSKSAVINALVKLDAAKIIAYSPSSDLPQITFMRPRAHVIKDVDGLIGMLKKTARNRMEAMHDYLSSEQCREDFIGQYFGEKSGKRCGKCDVCATRNRLAISSKKIKKIEDMLQTFLTDAPKSYDEILIHLNEDEDDIKLIMRSLIDDQVIRFTSTRKLEWGRR